MAPLQLPQRPHPAGAGDGVVHLLDDDGSAFPGAWPVAATDGAITGAAIAQCLGTFEPEIAVAGWNGEVSILWYDGDVGSGWPEQPDVATFYSDPIMARVDGSSSDVIAANHFNQAWAWTNVSAVIPGWPKPSSNRIDVAPAYGDLDLDGDQDLYLANGDLHHPHMSFTDGTYDGRYLYMAPWRRDADTDDIRAHGQVLRLDRDLQTDCFSL